MVCVSKLPYPVGITETLTAHTMLAKVMHLLDSSTHWAFAQVRDVLERLSCHLPMSLLGMRRLLLWHSLENTLPYSF